MNTELATAKYLAEQREAQSTETDADATTPENKGNWNRYLTIICLLFAVSSIFGALSAAYSGYRLSLPAEEINVARTAAEQELQKITQSRTHAVQKYFPMLVYNEIFKLVMAGSLMFAAVYLLSQSPKARSFALGVCCLAIFFHVSSLIVSILMIAETGAVVNSMMGDAVGQMDFQNEKQRDATLNYMQNSMISGMTVGLAIVFLIKLAFYGVIMAYLWSDEVKKIFGEDPLAYMEKEAAQQAASEGVPLPA